MADSLKSQPNWLPGSSALFRDNEIGQLIISQLYILKLRLCQGRAELNLCPSIVRSAQPFGWVTMVTAPAVRV